MMDEDPVEYSPDPIVERIKSRFTQRSMLGQSKYRKKLTRTDLDLLDWLRHMRDELMDATLYVERAIQELEMENGDGK
jgi:TPP-dependent pyruvate/acetoin dehydrogenase alpha subunit